VAEQFWGSRPARFVAATAAVLLSVVLGGGPAFATPTVDVRKAEWWLEPMGIAKAQRISQGAGVIVGLIDTGVDGTHPDLAGQILSGSGAYGLPGNGQGSTKVQQHGTNMAGLIVGKGGGENHMLGIAPRAKILPFAVPEHPTNADLVTAIHWEVDHGANVINISISGSATATADEVEAVNYALSKNVVVVASAGNVSQTGVAVGSPANAPGVVAVAGIQESGDFWDQSSRGPEVVVAAPAEHLISTAPSATDPSRYWINEGTSGGAALVSGLVALIRARYPDLDAANVINRLIKTAKDNGKAGRDHYFGFGTVRMVTALTASVPPVTRNPLTGGVAAPSSAAAFTPVTTRPSVTPMEKVLIIGIPIIFIVGVVILIVRASAKARARARPGGPNSNNVRW
jgi:type VII secretion-associated serine protease mycosin